MQPAGGVQEHQVVAVAFGVVNGVPGDFHRVALPLLINGEIQLLAHGDELVDGGGTVDVAGHQQRTLVLGLSHQRGQLGAVGGFARALQSDEHDHTRGL